MKICLKARDYSQNIGEIVIVELRRANPFVKVKDSEEFHNLVDAAQNYLV